MNSLAKCQVFAVPPSLSSLVKFADTCQVRSQFWVENGQYSLQRPHTQIQSLVSSFLCFFRSYLPSTKRKRADRQIQRLCALGISLSVRQVPGEMKNSLSFDTFIEITWFD